jgi:hypothetical protein
MSISPQRYAPPPGGHPESSRLIAEAAKAAVDQEFELTNRLDSKARNHMAIAAGWFGAVQAVTASSLAATGLDRNWVWAGGLLIVLGGAALCLAMWMSYQVWRLRIEKAVAPSELTTMLDLAERPDVDIQRRLAEYYIALLEHRRTSNAKRREALKKSLWWWGAALVIPFVQLILAMAARLYG